MKYLKNINCILSIVTILILVAFLSFIAVNHNATCAFFESSSSLKCVLQDKTICSETPAITFYFNIDSEYSRLRCPWKESTSATCYISTAISLSFILLLSLSKKTKSSWILYVTLAFGVLSAVGLFTAMSLMINDIVTGKTNRDLQDHLGFSQTVFIESVILVTSTLLLILTITAYEFRSSRKARQESLLDDQTEITQE